MYVRLGVLCGVVELVCFLSLGEIILEVPGGCLVKSLVEFLAKSLVLSVAESIVQSKCKMANYGFRGQEPFDPKSGQRPRSRDGCLSDMSPPPCAHRLSDSQTFRQSDMQTLIQSDNAGPVVLTSGDGQCCWPVALATIAVKSLV